MLNENRYIMEDVELLREHGLEVEFVVRGKAGPAIHVFPLELSNAGFNLEATSLLIRFDGMARLYPKTPPKDFYVSSELRWQGRKLRDFHPNWAPTGFAKLCMEELAGWSAEGDSLLTIVQLVLLRLDGVGKADTE